MTNAEIDGIHYLYSIAQPNSLLIEGLYSTPWQFQDFEKYNYYTLTEDLPEAVTAGDVDSIVRFITRENSTDAYLIFARSEKASAEILLGLPPKALDRLEDALLRSGNPEGDHLEGRLCPHCGKPKSEQAHPSEIEVGVQTNQ